MHGKTLGIIGGATVGLAGIVIVVTLAVNKAKNNDNAPFVTPSISIEQVDETALGNETGYDLVLKDDDPLMQADEDPNLDIDETKKTHIDGENNGISYSADFVTDFEDTDPMSAPYVKERAFLGEDGKWKMYWDTPDGLITVIDVDEWQFYEDVEPVLEGFEIVRKSSGELELHGTLQFTEGDVMGMGFKVVRKADGIAVVDSQVTAQDENSTTLGNKIIINQKISTLSRYDIDHLATGEYEYELTAYGTYFCNQTIVKGTLTIEEIEQPVSKAATNTSNSGSAYTMVDKNGNIMDWTIGGAANELNVTVVDEHTVTYDYAPGSSFITKRLYSEFFTEEQNRNIRKIYSNKDAKTYYIIPTEKGSYIKSEIEGSSVKGYQVLDYGEIRLDEPTLDIKNVNSMEELGDLVAINGGISYVYMKDLLSIVERETFSRVSPTGAVVVNQNFKTTIDINGKELYNNYKNITKGIDDVIEESRTILGDEEYNNLKYLWNNSIVEVQSDGEREIMIQTYNQGHAYDLIIVQDWSDGDTVNSEQFDTTIDLYGMIGLGKHGGIGLTFKMEGYDTESLEIQKYGMFGGNYILMDAPILADY